jgi:hypothetical protein
MKAQAQTQLTRHVKANLELKHRALDNVDEPPVKKGRRKKATTAFMCPSCEHHMLSGVWDGRIVRDGHPPAVDL